MKHASSGGVAADVLIAISLGLEVGAPRGGSFSVLETRPGSNGIRSITYRRELVKCGKKKCDRCSSSRCGGHGPYWYAYWRHGKRTRKEYIGKEFHELAKLSAELVANDLKGDDDDA